MLTRRKLTILTVILSATVLTLMVAAHYWCPLTLRRSVIKITSGSKWSEFSTLTKMLALGMDPGEVEKILGKPNTRDILSVGERWIYAEDGPTSGWACVVEFKTPENVTAEQPKLCYVLNIQHRVFPNSPRFEMGHRLILKKPEGTILLGLPPDSRKDVRTN